MKVLDQLVADGVKRTLLLQLDEQRFKAFTADQGPAEQHGLKRYEGLRLALDERIRAAKTSRQRMLVTSLLRSQCILRMVGP